MQGVLPYLDRSPGLRGAVMGAAIGHTIVVVHLTSRRPLDIINCDDVVNRILLEDYCKTHNLPLTYCKTNDAIRLLVSIGGTGFGVFTNADVDDKNECLFRKAMARHNQRELIALLGTWVIAEPIDLEYEDGSDMIQLVVG